MDIKKLGHVLGIYNTILEGTMLEGTMLEGTILCGHDTVTGSYAPYKFFKVTGKVTEAKGAKGAKALVCRQLKSVSDRKSKNQRYHTILPKNPETLIHEPVHMVPTKDAGVFVVDGGNKFIRFRVWDGTRLMCL